MAMPGVASGLGAWKDAAYIVSNKDFVAFGPMGQKPQLDMLNGSAWISPHARKGLKLSHVAPLGPMNMSNAGWSSGRDRCKWTPSGVYKDGASELGLDPEPGTSALWLTTVCASMCLFFLLFFLFSGDAPAFLGEAL